MNNPDARDLLSFIDWSRRNTRAAALLFSIVGTLVYFFGVVPLFVNRAETAAIWAWRAWTPEQNQEHSVLVPFICLYLIWYHRDEIRKAPKQGSDSGLPYVVIGIVLFLLSARCIEARMALMAVPFLLYGSIMFLWGKSVARILLFPCGFLIFLIPFGAVEQATFKLQFVITGIVGSLANIVGISIHAVGTTLSARDSSFHFEVAEGCSGIRSITALTMLSAVYAHLTQDRFWKKSTIIACSALFAIIGNVGRIFTILLVAKFMNADIAGGKYHEVSGFLIFPFAILAMLGVSKLLSLEFKNSKRPPPAKPRGGGVSYDY